MMIEGETLGYIQHDGSLGNSVGKYATLEEAFAAALKIGITMRDVDCTYFAI